MASKNVKNQEAIEDKIVTETAAQAVATETAEIPKAELTLDELRAEAARITEEVKQRQADARKARQLLKQTKAQQKALRDANRKVKPVRTAEKSSAPIMRTYQTGLDVTGWTSQEIIDKAAEMEKVFDRNVDILLSGNMLNDGGEVKHFGNVFHPAHHLDGDKWSLYYGGNLHVRPANGSTWDHAKIVIFPEGELDAWQRHESKLQKSGNRPRK